jgi:hypothetical protein
MALSPIYRPTIVKGVSLSGIIRNGGYHLTTFDVYENGRVSDWNFEDFDGFLKDVKKEWVVCSVPDGQELSCFHLGSWIIKSGHWYYTPDTYVDFIKNLILQMNPTWSNIHSYQEKKVNNIRIGESGDGTHYKPKPRYKNDVFPDRLDGAPFRLFHVKEGVYYLVFVVLYQDASLSVFMLDGEQQMTFEQFKAAAEQGDYQTSLAPGTKVVIEHLGEFVVEQEEYSNEIQEVIGEMEEEYREMRGEKTLSDQCLELFRAYEKEPTEELKEQLRVAYESVPEHLRMYILRDQDTKDYPIIEVLYGDDYWKDE